MLAKVGLEEMRFKSFHGYYVEENKIGGEYSLSVWYTYELKNGAFEDNLNDVINYEELYSICRKTMETNYKLLETLAHQMSLHILQEWSWIKHLEIYLKKINPPLPGQVQSTSIRLQIEN